MWPVLIFNAMWLSILIFYCLAFFWQARRDRARGTGFADKD